MKPVVLAILDGWAISQSREGNAVVQASTPNLDQLFQQFPHTQLACSGEAVGLMSGQMGDSNVGHLNIGAGRIVFQPLVRINRIVDEGGLSNNSVIVELMERARGHALHFLGLLSDGGVHSHIGHLKALLQLAKRKGLSEVYVHAFLDGRDVPPQSAQQYVDDLEAFMQQEGVGKIATVMGRYYAMDRDKRWDRVEKAYDAMVRGKGDSFASATEAIRAAYMAGVTDEFVLPAVLDEAGLIKPGDGVFMWNFRADRARQLMHVLKDEEFSSFERRELPAVHLAGMVQYEAGYPLPHAVMPQDLSLTLGEVVSQAGLSQVRIAETEKYAHVTFFLNGGREEPFSGEERILVQSPKVATYDQKPEMSAYEITEQVLSNMPKFDLVVVNFANLDMVGHTGDLGAAVRAVETVDDCVGRLSQAISQLGGALVLTADHGNAEQMVDPITGEPHTAHTANPVPCLVMAEGVAQLRSAGILADLAPTVLQLLGVEQPSAMTGQSLITKTV